MGSVGDCYDNAMAERVFATLECELLDRHRFRIRTEARGTVFDSLEGCTTRAVAAIPPWASSAPPASKGATKPTTLPLSLTRPPDRPSSRLHPRQSR